MAKFAQKCFADLLLNSIDYNLCRVIPLERREPRGRKLESRKTDECAITPPDICDVGSTSHGVGCLPKSCDTGKQ